MIIRGNALKIPLKNESVDCVVTSPPYWRLRDDQVDGQLGLEQTPEEFIGNLVLVFEGVKKVLKPKGTLWINLGDSYASGQGTCFNPGGGETSFGQKRKSAGVHPLDRGNKSTLARSGLKPKDLLGMPFELGKALRTSGWYWRACCPWIKRNSMPESVYDRPTQAIEYVLLFSKVPICIYDREAVKIKTSPDSHARARRGRGGPREREPGVTPKSADRGSRVKANADFHSRVTDVVEYRFRRNSDWFMDSWQGLLSDDAGDPLAFVVNSLGFNGSHFSTFPEKLVEPCILAGCPEGGLVFDPFAGSGTVGRVALRLRRRAVMMDLKPEYLQMMKGRTTDLQIEMIR